MWLQGEQPSRRRGSPWTWACILAELLREAITVWWSGDLQCGRPPEVL